MIEPRRPDPVVSWRDKLRTRLEQSRERVRDRTRDVAVDPVLHPPAGPSLALTAGLAVASAVLALGGLWAWQMWAYRSSEPIDDLLPMLVASDLEEPIDASAAASENGATPFPAPEAHGLSAPRQTAQDASSITPEPSEIIVHVSGAVEAPGVVTLMSGDRVVDAVAAAGEATSSADLERVNLAAVVVDGEHVHVPVVGEEMPPQLMPTSPSLGTGLPLDAAVEPIIDINSATAADLESLPGIGPAIAEAIIRTRIDRGPFLSIDELLEVPGIGDAKLALLAPRVVVG